MNKEELLNQLLSEPFYIKSSKGNYLSCKKVDGKWYTQGTEVKRKKDIEYLEKEFEEVKKDVEKEYNSVLKGLEYGIWDSGQLSIPDQKILDFMLKQGIAKRTPGVHGEHDTANGVARWIYTLNEDVEKEEQTHRLRNRKKSNSAKQAWKKHHYNYMRGIRQRERDNMKTSRDIKDESLSIKKLNEELDRLLKEPINEISDTLANAALEKRQQQLNQAASKFSRMQNAINKRNNRKEGKVKEKLYLDLAFELKLSRKAIETLREHGCIEYKEDDDYVVLPKGTPITIDGDNIIVFGIILPADNIRNNDREVVNIEDEIKDNVEQENNHLLL